LFKGVNVDAGALLMAGLGSALVVEAVRVYWRKISHMRAEDRHYVQVACCRSYKVAGIERGADQGRTVLVSLAGTGFGGQDELLAINRRHPDFASAMCLEVGDPVALRYAGTEFKDAGLVFHPPLYRIERQTDA
jgi:hypothetical protein